MHPVTICGKFMGDILCGLTVTGTEYEGATAKCAAAFELSLYESTEWICSMAVIKMISGVWGMHPKNSKKLWDFTFNSQ